MTWPRAISLVLAGMVGFVAGFYLGLFLLLSAVGLDEFAGWQFPLTTLPVGGILAGLAIVAISPFPRRMWRPVLGAAVTTALLVAVGLLVFDGDFGVAILLGGTLVVGTTVTVSVAIARGTRERV